MNVQDSSGPKRSFSVLIVDDEPAARAGLRTCVDWKELGCSCVHEAEDGNAGLKILAANQIDIVLTDIRMPKMNGMDFITELRSSGYRTPVIIISGHDDVEYLRAAIKAGAADYVLKPVDVRELTTAVQKGLDDIRRSESLNDRIAQLRENVLKAFFQEILIGAEASADDILKDARMLDLPILGSAVFIVAVVVTELPEIFPFIVDRQTFNRSIPIDARILHVRAEPGETVIVFSVQGNRSEIADGLVKAIAKLVKNFTSAVLCLGPQVTDYTDIHRAYRSAAVAAWNEIRKNKEGVRIIESKMGMNEKEIDFGMIPLRDLIAAGDRESIRTELHRMLAGDPDYSRMIAARVYGQLSFLASETRRDSRIRREKESAFWIRLPRITSAESMLEALMDSIDIVLSTRPPEAGENRIVQKVKDVVGVRYFSDLTIRGLAEEVSVTHTYLCRLFRESTGTTINQYITEIRMKRASELLIEEPGLPIGEVADRVGYLDAAYFSRMFTKHFGCGPKQFRDGFNHEDPL